MSHLGVTDEARAERSGCPWCDQGRSAASLVTTSMRFLAERQARTSEDSQWLVWLQYGDGP